MGYFVMVTDNRADMGREVNFRDGRFQKEEPFVSYLKLAPADRLPDFIRGRTLQKTFFCVSEKMKEVLDVYGCLVKCIPVFFTDFEYRSQMVYWNVDVKEENCLVQELYHDQEHLVLSSEPSQHLHMWKATMINTQYLLVSLELAENLLRRQMYGVRFFPVMETPERRQET